MVAVVFAKTVKVGVIETVLIGVMVEVEKKDVAIEAEVLLNLS